MKKIAFIVRTTLITISLLFVCNSLYGSPYESPIRFGFVGGRTPEGIVKQWSPLLDYLSREVGIPFEMVLREDYQGLIDALVEGDIDFFEGGAFCHISAMDTGIAELLATQVRRGKQTYRSAIIVSTDSDIKNMADLKGKRLALTDELSTSGYLMPRVMFKKAGISDPEDFFRTIVLTGYHDRSIDAILEGAIDVAAVGDFFVAFLPEKQKEKIRIIALSEPAPLGPVTTRKDADPELKKKVKEALLKFHKRTTKDILKIIEVDKFVDAKDWDEATIKEYRDEALKLPKLRYAIPYQRIPIVLKEHIDSEKQFSLKWMIGAFMIVAVILATAVFFLQRRLSTWIGIVTAAIVATVAAVFTLIQLLTLFSWINTFAATKLGDMENLNLRAVTAISGASAQSLDDILNVATMDKSVEWAKVIRNGHLISSNNPAEIGISIIDQIKTGTFDKSKADTIQVLDPIIVNGKRYATAQIGLSFKTLNKMIKRAISINSIAMAFALFAGIIVTILIRLKLGRPVREISRAVESLREGESVDIKHPDADLHKVTNSLNILGRELHEKQKLIDLQSVEKGRENIECNPEVTRLLAERFREMEDDNSSFRKLRATEAIGNSPMWLRCLRDTAIRARDREPAAILGPSGSGKTSIARVMHVLGPRANQPMGEFNCAEFQSGDPLIVLGKLFGYGTDCGIQGIDRKGQKGILEEFDGGTLFFDEMGILPMQAQQLLLLPLEGRAFNPAAGKGASKKVNVRFIFATNEPLEEMVHAGKIRHDLLRRIQSRGAVHIPSLADRRDDIEPLARYFLAILNSKDSKMLSFNLETISLLSRYGYDKYNVSGLMGEVNQAFDNAQFENSMAIEPKHLSKRLLDALGVSPEKVSKEQMSEFDDEEQRELVVLRKEKFNITRAEPHLDYAAGSKTLTNHFRGMVYQTLDRLEWDIETAAHEIGGSDSEQNTIEKIKSKISDYIANAKRHLESNTTSKLFNNLPQKYHPYVEKLLDTIRGGKI